MMPSSCSCKKSVVWGGKPRHHCLPLEPCVRRGGKMRVQVRSRLGVPADSCSPPLLAELPVWESSAAPLTSEPRICDRLGGVGVRRRVLGGGLEPSVPSAEGQPAAKVHMRANWWWGWDLFG